MTTKPQPLVTYSSRRAKLLNYAASAALWPLEQLLTWRARNDDAPICFIVGPPRSGTTLLYELVLSHFACGYFTNLSKRLFHVPVAATWLARGAMKRRQAAFDSVYGELSGIAAPNEAGRIWAHWMPYGAPYNLDLPGLTPLQMRRKLSAIARIAGQPMVVKNPILQSDMSQITDAFPDAVFLHIERDWADNARSLMKLRKDKETDDDTGWASLRPTGWEAFANADPLTQSCAQVMLSQKDLHDHLGQPDIKNRTLKLVYEDICADPKAAMDKVASFFKANAIDARPKPASADLSAMSVRHQPRDDTFDAIHACLTRLRAGGPSA